MTNGSIAFGMGRNMATCSFCAVLLPERSNISVKSTRRSPITLEVPTVRHPKTIRRRINARVGKYFCPVPVIIRCSLLLQDTLTYIRFFPTSGTLISSRTLLDCIAPLPAEPAPIFCPSGRNPAETGACFATRSKQASQCRSSHLSEAA